MRPQARTTANRRFAGNKGNTRVFPFLFGFQVSNRSSLQNILTGLLSIKKQAKSDWDLACCGCLLLCYCTVKLVELVMPPELAPMVVLPTPAVVARPAVLGALAMVATEACDELQWTFMVMS